MNSIGITSNDGWRISAWKISGTRHWRLRVCLERLCTRNGFRALIERPNSRGLQPVGAVYDRPGFFVQSRLEPEASDHYITTVRVFRTASKQSSSFLPPASYQNVDDIQDGLGLRIIDDGSIADSASPVNWRKRRKSSLEITRKWLEPLLQP